MKKVLVVLDGSSYPQYLVDFAVQIAKNTQSLLHPVFMKPQNVVGYPFPNDMSVANSEVFTAADESLDDRKLMESHFQLFKDDCTVAQVSFSNAGSIDVSIEELIDHSAFADLVIAENSFDPGYSLTELLVETHCPVMLIPRNAELPQQAILCYDESFSSMYAMKMYSYIFPEWNHLPTSVITINPKGDNGDRFDEYVSEWFLQHFKNLQTNTIIGNLHKELLSLVNKENNKAVVVMGAYGRNAASRLFHRSLANVVLENTDAILFIIHE